LSAPQLEPLEWQAHRDQWEIDLKGLVDRSLAVAEWEVPEIEDPLARGAHLPTAVDRRQAWFKRA
jgi:hypothetical protein